MKNNEKVDMIVFVQKFYIKMCDFHVIDIVVLD